MLAQRADNPARVKAFASHHFNTIYDARQKGAKRPPHVKTEPLRTKDDMKKFNNA